MRNIKIVVEYDGTGYHGFQRQDGSNLATIQETLEQKISLLTGEDTQVTASGRTDAGVHALGQVINFHTNCKIPAENIARALNSLLPGDIVAKSAEEVPLEFHAQFSAKTKVYRYSIYNHRVPSAFYGRYALFEPLKLDISAMQEAVTFCIGEQDFSAFRAAGSAAKSSVRTIYEAKVVKEDHLINIYLKANGFLYNMVRIITGTLLYVGRGKLQAEEMKQIIEKRDRSLAGPTAPPQGLFLMHVEY